MATPKPKKIADDYERPKTEAFKVMKIFAEWVVKLEVSPEDTDETLLLKAKQQIDNRKILSTHPVHDTIIKRLG